MSKLFSPLTIRSLTTKNRIVVSPMCQYSSTDGFSNDWHLVHLGSRAVSGAGIVITEATAVVAEGRISSYDLGIWKDEHIPGLSRIVQFIHAQGALAGIQLAHAGRKASCARPWEGGRQVSVEDGGWTTVAPSAIPFYEGDRVPLELDSKGIRDLIADFKAAAERAFKAGFKVIELHGAHGYLLHEFLSPTSNQRTDEYGGSFDNRVRLLIEIADAVRDIWPAEYPLFTRLSATDWTDGGWTVDDTVKLSGLLKAHGVDLIDCSSGGNVAGAKIPTGPGYQVGFAEAVKQGSDLLSGAVGLITSAEQAEEIIEKEQADLIFFARESLRNPYLPLNFSATLGEELAWPLQYERAKP